ncbi:MAG: efflux RND transporter periplasmic adaptor subunit [Nitrospiria bacterium]
MRLNKPYELMVLFAAPLVLVACNTSPSQGPGGPPPPPQVSVAAVIAKDVADWDEFTGRLEAVERVEIRPRIAGYVEKIYFQQGAEVKKGDLLFAIDPRPLQAELARAEADLARAKTKFDLAQSDLARAEELLQSKAISQQGYEQLTSSRQDSNSAVTAAQAAVLTARLNLDYTKIRSPINGRTSRAEVTAGNLVSGGGAASTLLTTVVSLDPIYAYFEGDEQVYLKYAELSRRGSRGTRNPIYLGLSNEEGHPHRGYVDFVDNALNPQTGTIRARAVFDNKARTFTPGLFARLKLVGRGTYRATLVNDRAIGTDQSKKFVLVVGADHKALYREVTLGPVIDGLRVVKRGLTGGELIVVNGLQRVRPGDAVTPQTVSMLEADTPAGAAEAPGHAPDPPPTTPPEAKPAEPPANKKAERFPAATTLAGR